MAKNIIVTLPIKDLKRSVAFFTKLGHEFKPELTNDNATCMILGGDIFAMLMLESSFASFTPKSIADAKTSTEVLVALSADSRDEVNRTVETAIAAGARRYREPNDQGFMYTWGFEDPDGHLWEYFYMDASAAKT